MGRKVTAKDVWEWWRFCVEHLDECDDEECDLYWEFIGWLKNKDIRLD